MPTTTASTTAPRAGGGGTSADYVDDTASPLDTSQVTGTAPSSSDTTGVSTGTETSSDQTSAPAVPPSVTFGTPSGTFQGSISVTLAADAGLTIRYTLDGTLPTATSTVYDAPIALTETKQVRARAYNGETPVGEPVTGIYVARTFDKPSDIPIIVMEGYGGGRPEKEVRFGQGGGESPPKQPYFDVAFMVFEPVNGAASIANPPSFVTRAGYRERGQSSAGAEKSPYKVEFWDEYNEDIDLPVLGMPAESDWAMIGEYYDKSQIQNAFIYGLGQELGLESVRVRFAELYINFDGGPLEESDYFGLYMLSEKIKNQKNRTNLKQLRPDVTTEPEISGGYILKFDQSALDSGEARIPCVGSQPLQRGAYNPQAACFNDLGIVDPEEPNSEQLAYITSFIQGFHDSLHETPIGDYSKYIDVQSFIDFMIVTELSAHVDAYVRSSHFHKDRNGLLEAGPLWDFNLGMASTNADPTGWRFETQLTSRGNDDWFYQLGKDPAFMAKFAQRWRELRQGILSNEALIARVEAIAAPLANAGQRDFERWPNSGGFFGGGGFGGFGGGGMGGGNQNAEQPTTWRGHVDKLITWLPTRLSWMDTAIESTPAQQ